MDGRAAHPGQHQILRKYLAGWLPSMMLGITAHDRVLVIDGFCGPGEYLGGEEGSPIIALRSYLDHHSRGAMTGEVIFIFTDEDPRRIEYLEKQAIPKLGKLPDKVKVYSEASKFDAEMNGILDRLQEHGRRLAPAFAFLDPFGFSDTPMSLIHRILGNRHSEVLVTVVLEPVNRFLAHRNETIARHFDGLFGDTGWRALIDSPRRLDALSDFYGQQLKRAAKYVWSFRMLDDGNRPIYDMFFGGNHFEGLKKIKSAMWSVDPVAGLRFSDREEGGTITLFDADPDFLALRRRLLDQFRGKRVRYDTVEEWVLTETPFHAGHIKRRTLVPMEDDGLIEYVPSPLRAEKRRAHSFPDGCSIRFL